MTSSTSQLQPATFAEFKQGCERGNVVAVSRSFNFAGLDPIDAFVRLAGSKPYAFLFESVEGNEAVAKYSFVGADPYMIVRGSGQETIVEKEGSVERHQQTVPEFLKDHFAQHKLASRGDLGPLAGGAVGYLGYGAARWFEPALNKPNLKRFSNSSADAFLMFFRTVVLFDRAQQTTEIISIVFTDESTNENGLNQQYESALAEIQRTQEQLTHVPQRGAKSLSKGSATEVSSNMTRADFEKGVAEIKEYILSGDCYQVVLSQRFSRATTADAVSIYRALRESNPAPYTYLLKSGNDAIIGASPEMLVRSRDQQLDYRPIAGTRPRGATPEEDSELAAEMRNDEKELAEHMMLVDLGRNDLGRVAAFGSVKVNELVSVERYSKVQHLVSSLSASLRAGCDRFDALAACFPAGTVTGAPKVRAMEIIDELEPDARGVYAGAVLYIDYADNLDSCIAIRTIELKGNIASVQAGAGIVADSVAEFEFEETKHKAQALLRAIELAETANE
jgi:anthranilate synthase component 1